MIVGERQKDTSQFRQLNLLPLHILHFITSSHAFSSPLPVFTALFAVEVCFSWTPPEAGALHGKADKYADQFPADQGEHHGNHYERQKHGMK